MYTLRNHILSKALVILLSMVLVAPLFVKLNHLIEDHKHEICKTPNKLHFHNLELDCDFYDFRLNTYLYIEFESIEIPLVKDIRVTIDSQYEFISNYQSLQFSLRGPPVNV